MYLIINENYNYNEAYNRNCKSEDDASRYLITQMLVREYNYQ